MMSQTRWGLSFIVIGLIIAPAYLPFTLIYSIPLIALGSALLVFRKRESLIEREAN